MTDAPENLAYANYDLRAADPVAQKPSIRFAFEFPELLEKFVPADKAALAARGRSRILGMFAIFLFVTYYLQESLHYTPIQTGISFLPMVGMLVIAAQIGTNVVVFANDDGNAANGSDDAVVLVGRTLNDIAFGNIVA